MRKPQPRTDATREAERRYKESPKGKLAARRHEQAYYWRNHAKKRARESLKHAVKMGKVVRPSVCEGCKEPCKPEAHHHLGYAWEHRFTVQWLCRPCHRAAEHA
jgi:hypothetical protein